MPKFPHSEFIIRFHIISHNFSGHGFTVCRQYFDIPSDTPGITVPNIRQWSGPVAGFSFHCWIRLDQLDTMDMQRRQVYSFYTSRYTERRGFESGSGQKNLFFRAD